VETWDGCDCVAGTPPVDPGCDDGDCSNGVETWDGCECVAGIPPIPCVDDGDCSNGIEMWNAATCECDITIIDCSNGTTSVVGCDDGDIFTINDMQTILDCTGEICVPCAGTPVDCSNGTTTVVTCDDGDPCTINDEQTILDSDGTICIPCEGSPTTTPVPTIDDLFTVCLGDELTVTAVSNQGELNWFENNPATGATPIFVGNTFVPTLNNAGTTEFWVSASLNDCESEAVNFNIDVISSPVATGMQVIQPTCLNEDSGTIELGTITGGTAPYEIFLNDVSMGSQLIFNDLSVGVYDLTVVDQNLCQWEETVIINQPQELTMNLLADLTEVFVGETIQLDIQLNQPFDNIASMNWSDTTGLSCLTCLEPILTPLASTNYTLEVVDSNGCVASDALSVIVKNTIPVYVPNVFSPNNDGINDLFMAYCELDGVQLNYLRIFDRQGNQVFSGNKMTLNVDGWDGRFRGELLNPGVFVYVLEVENLIGKKELIKGSVTLIK
jgi:gliding motility-associated-like protein